MGPSWSNFSRFFDISNPILDTLTPRTMGESSKKNSTHSITNWSFSQHQIVFAQDQLVFFCKRISNRGNDLPRMCTSSQECNDLRRHPTHRVVREEVLAYLQSKQRNSSGKVTLLETLIWHGNMFRQDYNRQNMYACTDKMFFTVALRCINLKQPQCKV